LLHIKTARIKNSKSETVSRIRGSGVQKGIPQLALAVMLEMRLKVTRKAQAGSKFAVNFLASNIDAKFKIGAKQHSRQIHVKFKANFNANSRWN